MSRNGRRTLLESHLWTSAIRPLPNFFYNNLFMYLVCIMLPSFSILQCSQTNEKQQRKMFIKLRCAIYWYYDDVVFTLVIMYEPFRLR